MGERTEVRSYSTVGDGANGLCRIAVKLLADTRGGSAYMWRLGPGARLTMSAAARNRFRLSRDRPDYLLVAGGIGITPLCGMALALADPAFADELRERIGNRLEVVAGRPVNLPAAIGNLLPVGGMYVFVAPILFAIFSGGWVLRRSC
jgi:NAD(P)H-flavin reductase